MSTFFSSVQLHWGNVSLGVGVRCARVLYAACAHSVTLLDRAAGKQAGGRARGREAREAALLQAQAGCRGRRCRLCRQGSRQADWLAAGIEPRCLVGCLAGRSVGWLVGR